MLFKWWNKKKKLNEEDYWGCMGPRTKEALLKTGKFSVLENLPEGKVNGDIIESFKSNPNELLIKLAKINFFETETILPGDIRYFKNGDQIFEKSSKKTFLVKDDAFIQIDSYAYDTSSFFNPQRKHLEKCPYCGATLTSEKCEYCGSFVNYWLDNNDNDQPPIMWSV